jgi:hypothetical protein
MSSRMRENEGHNCEQTSVTVMELKAVTPLETLSSAYPATSVPTAKPVHVSPTLLYLRQYGVET